MGKNDYENINKEQNNKIKEKELFSIIDKRLKSKVL